MTIACARLWLGEGLEAAEKGSVMGFQELREAVPVRQVREMRKVPEQANAVS